MRRKKKRKKKMESGREEGRERGGGGERERKAIQYHRSSWSCEQFQKQARRHWWKQGGAGRHSPPKCWWCTLSLHWSPSSFLHSHGGSLGRSQCWLGSVLRFLLRCRGSPVKVEGDLKLRFGVGRRKEGKKEGNIKAKEKRKRGKESQDHLQSVSKGSNAISFRSHQGFRMSH